MGGWGDVKERNKHSCQKCGVFLCVARCRAIIILIALHIIIGVDICKTIYIYMIYSSKNLLNMVFQVSENREW